MVDEQTIRSLRGYYTWGGGDDIPVPTSARAKLRYKRFTMRDLWPERDRFDWSSLDGELDRAVRNGQLYSLRLRAMGGEGKGVPDWVIAQGLTRESVLLDSNKPITIPNHDDPAWITLMREFVKQVADHCNARNPGLVVLVDIGMLGRWGEGHFSGIKGDGTVNATKFWMPSVAAQRAIVDAHVEAFGNSARLVCLTGPDDMLKYALLEAKSPAPIGWRRDSLGHKSFDDLSRNSTLATLLKERAKVAPVVTEFFGPSGPFTGKASREQATRWGVWLVGNGNLDKEWKDYTPEEQADFLALGDEIVKAGAVVVDPGPRPGPDTKPPAVDGATLAELRAQVQTLQAKVDALTTLLQTANLGAVQTKIDALTALLQSSNLAALQTKVDTLTTLVQAVDVTPLQTKLDALAGLVQQERRFVVETTVREVSETEHILG